MFDWLRNLLGRKKKRAPTKLVWPRHLFIEVRDRGLTYAGEVNDEDEASDKAQILVAQLVMMSGEMAWSDYWTSVKERFTKDELAAFEANPDVSKRWSKVKA